MDKYSPVKAGMEIDKKVNLFAFSICDLKKIF